MSNTTAAVSGAAGCPVASDARLSGDSSGAGSDIGAVLVGVGELSVTVVTSGDRGQVPVRRFSKRLRSRIAAALKNRTRTSRTRPAAAAAFFQPISAPG